MMCRGVKKQRGKQFAFVTFNTIEERDTAWKLIEEIEVEGKLLKCKEVGWIAIGICVDW